MILWKPKTPTEILERGCDWTNRLNGKTISSSTYTAVNPVTGNATNSGDSFSGAITKSKFSAGLLNKDYDFLNVVITTDGLRMEQTMRLPIREK